MASSNFRSRGFNVNDIVSITAGVVDPSAALGIAAPEGSMYNRYVDGAGELWIKTGAADTAWAIAGTGVNDDAFQNAFVGKTVLGTETTAYTSDNGTTQSNNVVTDGESLLDSVGKVDAAIGAPVTATNYVSDQAVNLNIDSLDAAVKANADAVGAAAGALAWKESVYVITADALSAGAAPTTFADDEGGAVAAPSEGQFLLSTNDNTLWKVVSGNLVAATLTENDTFMVQNTVSDSPDAEEGSSIWAYVDSALVKIADVDWDVAEAINLSNAFPTVVDGKTVGDAIVGGDSVESAIAQLEANQGDNLTDGSYVVSTNTLQENLSALDAAASAAAASAVRSTLADAVHVEIPLDTVLVTAVEGVEWTVIIKETGGTGRYASKIMAVNDGAADGNVDFSEYGIVEIGSTLDPTLDVEISGTNMTVLVTTSVSATVSIMRVALDSDPA